jgi:hypothetical protein
LTAARRHAGGVATATRAATAKMAKMVEAFANMVLIFLLCSVVCLWAKTGIKGAGKGWWMKKKYKRCSSNEWEVAGGV